MASQQTDDDMLEYLMSIGALQPEQENIARKQAMISQLRQQGRLPEMRQAGRLVVASNPFETLGSVLHQGLGQYEQGNMEKMQDEYGNKRRGLMTDLQARMKSRRLPPNQQSQISGGFVPPSVQEGDPIY
jgi:hypothetical protein